MKCSKTPEKYAANILDNSTTKSEGKCVSANDW